MEVLDLEKQVEVSIGFDLLEFSDIFTDTHYEDPKRKQYHGRGPKSIHPSAIWRIRTGREYIGRSQHR